MKKLIRRLILAVVVLLVLAGAAVWLFPDMIAKAGIERGAGYALGVKTGVDHVNLSLLKGRLTIEGLSIANPEGFSSRHAMRTGSFHLEIQPLSVLSDTVDIGRFELDGLDMNVEQTLAGSNFKKILDNVKRLGGNEAKPQPKSEGKKVQVNRIVIKNVVAHFYLAGEAAGGEGVTVKVPQIELTDVSTADHKATVAQLAERLVPAILQAVLTKGQGVIPAGLAGDLRGQLSGLLGGKAGELLKQIQDKPGSVFEKTAEEILPGLLKGGKKQE